MKVGIYNAVSAAIMAFAAGLILGLILGTAMAHSPAQTDPNSPQGTQPK